MNQAENIVQFTYPCRESFMEKRLACRCLATGTYVHNVVASRPVDL